MSGSETKRDVKSFEDLEVFQRAYRLSLEVHKLSLGFPSIEQQGLADQLRRASKSFAPTWRRGLPSSVDRRRSSSGFW